MTFDNDIAMPSAVKLNKRQKKGRFVLKDGKGYAYIHKSLFEADEVITDGKENLDLKGQFPKYENILYYKCCFLHRSFTPVQI